MGQNNNKAKRNKQRRQRKIIQRKEDLRLLENTSTMYDFKDKKLLLLAEKYEQYLSEDTKGKYLAYVRKTVNDYIYLGSTKEVYPINYKK